MNLVAQDVQRRTRDARSIVRWTTAAVGVVAACGTAIFAGLASRHNAAASSGNPAAAVSDSGASTSSSQFQSDPGMFPPGAQAPSAGSGPGLSVSGGS